MSNSSLKEIVSENKTGPPFDGRKATTGIMSALIGAREPSLVGARTNRLPTIANDLSLAISEGKDCMSGRSVPGGIEGHCCVRKCKWSWLEDMVKSALEGSSVVDRVVVSTLLDCRSTTAPVAESNRVLSFGPMRPMRPFER